MEKERYAILPVENGKILGAIRRFLADLLQKKLVDALLVPLELPTGDNVVPTIVSNPEQLQRANPLAAVMPVSSSRLVSRITLVSPSPERLGVVLRSCELRALIELVKLKQASLDNLLLIGIDCFGTYSIDDYGKLVQEGSSPTEHYLNGIKEGKEDALLRKACQSCEYPVPMGADLTIGLLGADLDKGLLLAAGTPEGEKVINELGLEDAKAEDREAAIAELMAERAHKREEMLKQAREEVHGLDKLMAALAPCINCHNCKTACPLCYCKECFFDSPVFEFEAEKYLSWAKRKGALRMPSDTLLFHLTRLNHMVVSCVGCGLCTEACPNNIQVADIFRLVGEEVQKLFDYVPGRSLDEELPLTTFREEELTDIGT
jgi:formate dehydrogenase subunit beta